MKKNINYIDLLLALANSVDMASPEISQHQLRVAYIALQISDISNLPKDMVKNIFLASLLHDIGAISFEEKISLHNFETDLVEPHCKRGEILLNRIPDFSNISKIILHHHTPIINFSEDIDSYYVMSSQIVQLSDFVERFIDRKKYILNQVEDIISSIQSLSNERILPSIIKNFVEISKKESFWLDIVSKDIISIINGNPTLQTIKTENIDTLVISKLFRDLIDYKSSFTATHSAGVAASSRLLAELYGFSQSELHDIEVAGNLHDLGKLIVPKYILDKAETLTKEEYNIIRSHTYYTYHVINSISGLEIIAEWAAFHHENLIGTGYPFHLLGDNISIGSRIVAVSDLFTALIEDRPYRKGMSKKEIFKIFNELISSNKIDKKITHILFDNFEYIYEHVKALQSSIFEFYSTRIQA